MGYTSSYYINAPTLELATAIYEDEDLTICATNGLYSDGTITREQVACVLLPPQICPSCVSYNCISGVCTNPGNGTGEFATLAECEAICGVVEYDVYLANKYACGTCTLITSNVLVRLPVGTVPVFGNFYLPVAASGELGDYVYELLSLTEGSSGRILTTLNYATCGTACATTPPVSYNCISGGCYDPGDGTGTYPTLGDCVESCGVSVTYNCVEGTCSDPGDGTGAYSTLLACEEDCSGITYAKYIAEVRDCADCNVVVNTILVAFDDSLTLPTIGLYYEPASGPNGFAYQVVSTSTSTDAGLVLTTLNSFATCTILCSA
jgi:hypothetical protein